VTVFRAEDHKEHGTDTESLLSIFKGMYPNGMDFAEFYKI
jgi:hypothetical protein